MNHLQTLADRVYNLHIDKTCPICYEEIATIEENHTTTCGHIFHKTCFTKALENRNVCPTCNTVQVAIQQNYNSLTSDPVYINNSSNPSNLERMINHSFESSFNSRSRNQSSERYIKKSKKSPGRYKKRSKKSPPKNRRSKKY